MAADSVIHINTQPMDKRITRTPEHLTIVGRFTTIQGEGPFCGRPAIFVRLANCNLQCPGCDTDYTSTAHTVSTQWLVNRIIEDANNNCDIGLVVITGGEPFKQDISLLAQELVNAGMTVQVETNGSMRPCDNLPKEVVVVCSPKTSRLNSKMAERVDYFKYVLFHNDVANDGLPIKALGNEIKIQGETVARPPESYAGPIYLQPMDCYDDETNRLNMVATVDSCIKHGYTLQLQVHKYANVE